MSEITRLLLKKYKMATDLIIEILEEYAKIDPVKTAEYLVKAQKIKDER